MAKVQSKHYESIAWTPVMRQAHLVQAEFIRIGAVDGYEPGLDGSEQCNAILNEDGSIISMIVWSMDPPMARIVQSWTHPDFRRQGFHSMVFEQFCDEARSQGAKYAVGKIHHGNKAMIESAKKCGRVPTFLDMEKEL